jgi:formylmethanofuran dehydrogenase subunit C
MPQENLNNILHAGKFFEPKPEQPEKELNPDKNKPSNVKRKISVVKAFMPEKEDPFKKKVEAVLKGMEPASAPTAADKEEKPIPADAEVIVGTGQDDIGKDLLAGKSIRVFGDTGKWTGEYMSGGEIHVEGDVGDQTGRFMSGGEIHVERNAGYFIGSFMNGGEIHVKGNAGDYAGYSMSGGTLRIDGDVASFDKTAFTPKNKGIIIWKGEIIWKDGKTVEPGWTNLKVDEKIAK